MCIDTQWGCPTDGLESAVEKRVGASFGFEEWGSIRVSFDDTQCLSDVCVCIDSLS